MPILESDVNPEEIESVSRYQQIEGPLVREPRVWLVTGCAGFIGSNLLEQLLRLGQRVIGLDNFVAGQRRNVDAAVAAAGMGAAERFAFVEGDIGDLNLCREASTGVYLVLHQSALGSVPRSLHDPIATNRTNVDGFLNMPVAARNAGVKRFVYAASSSTYGDHPGLPKVEEVIGRPLPPYAVAKYVNELYESVFERNSGLETVGLRYFNAFGRRQDPNGAYAAVIPRWVGNLLNGEPCQINGDEETSHDFCYIDNAVQASLLAATVPEQDWTDQVHNVACKERTTLNQLFETIFDGLATYRAQIRTVRPEHAEFRPGDVRHSQADIAKFRKCLGYRPSHLVAQGLGGALSWYVTQLESDARGEAA